MSARSILIAILVAAPAILPGAGALPDSGDAAYLLTAVDPLMDWTSDGAGAVGDVALRAAGDLARIRVDPQGDPASEAFGLAVRAKDATVQGAITLKDDALGGATGIKDGATAAAIGGKEVLWNATVVGKDSAWSGAIDAKDAAFQAAIDGKDAAWRTALALKPGLYASFGIASNGGASAVAKIEAAGMATAIGPAYELAKPIVFAQLRPCESGWELVAARSCLAVPVHYDDGQGEDDVAGSAEAGAAGADHTTAGWPTSAWPHCPPDIQGARFGYVLYDTDGRGEQGCHYWTPAGTTPALKVQAMSHRGGAAKIGLLAPQNGQPATLVVHRFTSQLSAVRVYVGAQSLLYEFKHPDGSRQLHPDSITVKLSGVTTSGGLLGGSPTLSPTLTVDVLMTGTKRNGMSIYAIPDRAAPTRAYRVDLGTLSNVGGSGAYQHPVPLHFKVTVTFEGDASSGLVKLGYDIVPANNEPDPERATPLAVRWPGQGVPLVINAVPDGLDGEITFTNQGNTVTARGYLEMGGPAITVNEVKLPLGGGGLVLKHVPTLTGLVFRSDAGSASVSVRLARPGAAIEFKDPDGGAVAIRDIPAVRIDVALDQATKSVSYKETLTPGVDPGPKRAHLDVANAFGVKRAEASEIIAFDVTPAADIKDMKVSVEFTDLATNKLFVDFGEVIQLDARNVKRVKVESLKLKFEFQPGLGIVNKLNGLISGARLESKGKGLTTITIHGGEASYTDAALHLLNFKAAQQGYFAATGVKRIPWTCGDSTMNAEIRQINSVHYATSTSVELPCLPDKSKNEELEILRGEYSYTFEYLGRDIVHYSVNPNYA